MRHFLSSKGNKYILVVVDYISKWLETIANPTNDSRVVPALFKKIIFPGMEFQGYSLATMECTS